MSAQIIPFPQRGPFVVSVEAGEDGWLVLCKSHGWLHGNFREAFLDAKNIAAGFGVAVEVAA
jgi:hypothetical protein